MTCRAWISAILGPITARFPPGIKAGPILGDLVVVFGDAGFQDSQGYARWRAVNVGAWQGSGNEW